MKHIRFIAALLVTVSLFGLLAGCGAKQTVSFDLNFQTQQVTPTAIEVSGKYSALPEPDETIRPGYTFDGWYLSAAGTGKEITTDSPVSAKGDHTLYAKWKGIQYTVSFDLQGGTAADNVETTQVTFGNVYGTSVFPEEPKREGYKFKGWYYDAQGTVGPVQTVTVVETASDHTLYAHWVALVDFFDFESEAHIDFFDNRGNGFALSVVEKDGSNRLRITNPTKFGSENYLAMRTELKAGTVVTMDVTFDGELSENSEMVVACYGANPAAEPLPNTLAGKPGEENGVRYWGASVKAQLKDDIWQHGEGSWENGQTAHLRFRVVEDIFGIVMQLNFGTDTTAEQWQNTKIYFDNIRLIQPEEEV